MPVILSRLFIDFKNYILYDHDNTKIFLYKIFFWDLLSNLHV